MRATKGYSQSEEQILIFTIYVILFIQQFAKIEQILSSLSLISVLFCKSKQIIAHIFYFILIISSPKNPSNLVCLLIRMKEPFFRQIVIWWIEQVGFSCHLERTFKDKFSSSKSGTMFYLS